MQNLAILSRIINCHSSYWGLRFIFNINILSTNKFLANFSVNGKNYTIKSHDRNMDQNYVLDGKGKTKVLKRNIRARPLTEEQKKKRKEYFLKEEEWERNVDFRRLTDRGIIKKLPQKCAKIEREI